MLKKAAIKIEKVKICWEELALLKMCEAGW